MSRHTLHLAYPPLAASESTVNKSSFLREESSKDPLGEQQQVLFDTWDPFEKVKRLLTINLMDRLSWQSCTTHTSLSIGSQLVSLKDLAFTQGWQT